MANNTIFFLTFTSSKQTNSKQQTMGICCCFCSCLILQTKQTKIINSVVVQPSKRPTSRHNTTGLGWAGMTSETEEKLSDPLAINITYTANFMRKSFQSNVWNFGFCSFHFFQSLVLCVPLEPTTMMSAWPYATYNTYVFPIVPIGRRTKWQTDKLRTMSEHVVVNDSCS